MPTRAPGTQAFTRYGAGRDGAVGNHGSTAMYAVIRTGGKQYRVAKDDVIRVEKLEAEAGAKIKLDQVLLVGGKGDPRVGKPLVDGASVTAEVVDQARSRKVIVFKKKRRKNYRRTPGHRQHQTVLKITGISAGA